MDPYVAFLTWLTFRGDASGPLFCDIAQNWDVITINPRKPMSADRFSSLMRDRIMELGIGGDALLYTGHPLKRGSAQSHRSFGLRDEYVKQRIQMSGERAYQNYCAAYNDCIPRDHLRFASVNDYIAHATNIAGEEEVLLDSTRFDHFMSNFLGVIPS